mgnify:CR=1
IVKINQTPIQTFVSFINKKGDFGFPFFIYIDSILLTFNQIVIRQSLSI